MIFPDFFIVQFNNHYLGFKGKKLYFQDTTGLFTEADVISNLRNLTTITLTLLALIEKNIEPFSHKLDNILHTFQSS